MWGAHVRALVRGARAIRVHSRRVPNLLPALLQLLLKGARGRSGGRSIVSSELLRRDPLLYLHCRELQLLPAIRQRVTSKRRPVLWLDGPRWEDYDRPSPASHGSIPRVARIDPGWLCAYYPYYVCMLVSSLLPFFFAFYTYVYYCMQTDYHEGL